MGRSENEGRVPILMTSAVASKATKSYFFSLIFDVPSMGHPA
jgi:hypothetical protein